MDFTSAAIALALIGGCLVGVGASLLLLFTGRFAGVAGIVVGVGQGPASERAWRGAFVAGLVAGGVLFALFYPSAFAPSPASLAVLLVAGGAVGFGARLGGGCTSGHGVCGVSRLSTRAFAATVTFMLVGAIVVALARIAGAR